MPATNAILVNLSMTAWDANRQDKRVSAEVATANNVEDSKMCRVRKSLLPRSKEMNKIRSVATSARQFHYANTHAWTFDGPRVLTTANYSTYMKKMQEFKAEYQTAVQNFLLSYDSLRAKSEKALGTMFDPLDYPGVNSLTARFSFSVDIQALPASVALLDLGFDSEEAEQMRSLMDTQIEKTYQNAQNKLWEDLAAKVEKMHVRLQDSESPILGSSLANLQAYAQLIPNICLQDDPALLSIASSVDASLSTVTAESLKADSGKREKLAATMATIHSALQGYVAKHVPKHATSAVAASV